MKKVLLALAALLLLASPALAVPSDDTTGPEPPVVDAHGVVKNWFNIEITAANLPLGHQNDPGVIKERRVEHFEMIDGWDFGDRAAYSCAWVEYFQGTDEKFEVHFDAVSDYPNFVEINDRWGREANDGDPIYTFPNLRAFCQATSSAQYTDVVNPKTGAVTKRFFHDGTDHFPHMIHDGDGIQFYQDGQPMLDPQGDPVFMPLQQPSCSKLYYVPGDEPGEVWLWWDEDGPTFSHGPGEGDLNCGGGPLEPVALIRVGVSQADPDVGWCTVSMHEQQCYNAEPPPTPIMFTESGKFALTCMDGSTPAIESTEPLVVVCA